MWNPVEKFTHTCIYPAERRGNEMNFFPLWQIVRKVLFILLKYRISLLALNSFRDTPFCFVVPFYAVKHK